MCHLCMNPVRLIQNLLTTISKAHSKNVYRILEPTGICPSIRRRRSCTKLASSSFIRPAMSSRVGSSTSRYLAMPPLQHLAKLRTANIFLNKCSQKQGRSRGGGCCDMCWRQKTVMVQPGTGEIICKRHHYHHHHHHRHHHNTTTTSTTTTTTTVYY